jgi:ATP-dependent helicase/nuclease subunit B
VWPQETPPPPPPRAGVPVLDAVTASGRRFRRVYVTGAVADAYSAGEREDYFFPEDVRRDLQGAAAEAWLPRLHRGRDAALAAELLARGDEVVVSAAEADRGGPVRLDGRLVVDPTPPLPQPAGSVLEVTTGVPFRPVDGPVDDGGVTAEALRRSDPCTFRVWAERLAPEPEERLPWGVRLRRALTAEPHLDAHRLAQVATSFPDAAAWLERHADALQALAFGVRLPTSPDLPQARLDAARRDGDVARIVRFLAADEDPAALLDASRRWNELYAVRSLLRHPRVSAVHVVAWPLLGDPRDLTPAGIGRGDAARLDAVARLVDAQWRRWRRGPAEPTPGYHCARCSVRDVCREAQGR